MLLDRKVIVVLKSFVDMGKLAVDYYFHLSLYTGFYLLTFTFSSSVGRVFHASPTVLHYRNKEKCGIMREGHTFTIEPMICMGNGPQSNVPLIWDDKWTAATKDGSWTAQFEHTLLITPDGVEALTAKLPTSPKFSWEKM